MLQAKANAAGEFVCGGKGDRGGGSVGSYAGSWHQPAVTSFVSRPLRGVSGSRCMLRPTFGAGASHLRRVNRGVYMRAAGRDGASSHRSRGHTIVGCRCCASAARGRCCWPSDVHIFPSATYSNGVSCIGLSGELQLAAGGSQRAASGSAGAHDSGAPLLREYELSAETRTAPWRCPSSQTSSRALQPAISTKLHCVRCRQSSNVLKEHFFFISRRWYGDPAARPDELPAVHPTSPPLSGVQPWLPEHCFWA